MSFFLKNADNGELLYKQDFTEDDFNIRGYLSQAHSLDLPFGKAQITQWHIEGIRLFYTEMQCNTPATVNWSSNTEIITLFFNLQGQLAITDFNTSISFKLFGNRHNMLYSHSAEGQIHMNELKMKWFGVLITKKAFLTLSNSGNADLKRFSESVTIGKQAAFSDINLPIDFEIQNCINQVIHCPYGDELKPIFLLSKVMELLVLQADAYKRAHTVTSKVLKTEYDYERIIFARDYLLKNIDVPPSLAQLAHVVGINEFKLKKGFKETFNQSVFQYLSNTRLETAKIYLLEGSKTPTELAFELGYSSLQHFSTAFKKKFGMPPNQVRR